MLLFSHLFTGLIIGFILFWYFRDPILIVACSIGSVLPDLIDKPLGQLLWASTIGYGRIYGHTVMFSIIILFLGIAILWKFHSLAGIALCLGVVSHQLLDLMWLEPVNWYYPLLGPFSKPVIYGTKYNITLIKELQNPSEWLFGSIAVLILIQVLRVHNLPQHQYLYTIITYLLTSILVVCSIFILYCGANGQYCFLTGYTYPLYNIVTGFIIISVIAMILIITIKKRVL